MNKNNSKIIKDKISEFRFQLIINKNLLIEKIITEELYYRMENNLNEKIKKLSMELGM